MTSPRGRGSWAAWRLWLCGSSWENARGCLMRRGPPSTPSRMRSAPGSKATIRATVSVVIAATMAVTETNRTTMSHAAPHSNGRCSVSRCVLHGGVWCSCPPPPDYSAAVERGRYAMKKVKEMMASKPNGPMTDEEIDQVWGMSPMCDRCKALPRINDCGRCRNIFARALLREAGDRLHEELKFSMSHDTANAIRRILGVREDK